MGRVTLEQRLIAARPDQADNDDLFVVQVMEKIEKPVIKLAFVRTTSEQHNRKGGLFMSKLRMLPIGVLAAIIIGGTALTGGVVYAVYKTVIEPLRVEQTQSVTGNNKNMTTFAVEGCPSSFEGISQSAITAITKADSGITNEEAKKYVIARCEINAVEKYAHDLDAANGNARYNSSVLGAKVPLVMPAQSVSTLTTDIGPRTITGTTKFFKDGKQVERSALPEGSLILVAYGGVPSKSAPEVFLVMAASVDTKYYEDAYEVGRVLQRVPCFNNPSESCFSDVPGYTFYEAVSVHTGPVPSEERRYADAISNGTYIQLGGVVTYVDGNVFTFRTSTGRIVTFYLPAEVLKRDLYPEHMPPTVGTEINITTIGTDRDVISSDDLLSGWKPDLSN